MFNILDSFRLKNEKEEFQTIIANIEAGVAGANVLFTQYGTNNSATQMGLSLRLLTASIKLDEKGNKMTMPSNPAGGANGTYLAEGPRLTEGSSLEFIFNERNSNFTIRTGFGAYGGGVAKAFQNDIVHRLGGFPYHVDGTNTRIGGHIEVSGTTSSDQCGSDCN